MVRYKVLHEPLRRTGTAGITYRSSCGRRIQMAVVAAVRPCCFAGNFFWRVRESANCGPCVAYAVTRGAFTWDLSKRVVPSAVQLPALRRPSALQYGSIQGTETCCSSFLAIRAVVAECLRRVLYQVRSRMDQHSGSTGTTCCRNVDVRKFCWMSRHLLHILHMLHM